MGSASSHLSREALISELESRLKNLYTSYNISARILTKVPYGDGPHEVFDMTFEHLFEKRLYVVRETWDAVAEEKARETYEVFQRPEHYGWTGYTLSGLAYANGMDIPREIFKPVQIPR